MKTITSGSTPHATYSAGLVQRPADPTNFLRRRGLPNDSVYSAPSPADRSAALTADFVRTITYPVALVGELFGETGRAAILVALLDGCARTAGELAMVANISAQSASGHLSKLVDGGLLVMQRSGRHRYYSLAGADVAHAIETLGSIATQPRAMSAKATESAAKTGRGLGQRRTAQIYIARSCYDHLAGRVAVELAQMLEQSKLIWVVGERECEIGPDGRDWFSKMGIDVDAVRRCRRSFARQCLDWTERRPHLAGALGAAIFSRMLAMGWIARLGNTRAVRFTHLGEGELHARFGIVA
jgi:DNA-binding transcriptional ArsR family regulator